MLEMAAACPANGIFLGSDSVAFMAINAEIVRPEIEVENPSSRLFDPAEATTIQELSPEARLAPFFAC